MKQPKKKKIKFFIPILILCMLLLFVGMLCFFAAKWYKSVYGDVGFDSILYTLLSDLGGVESDLIMEFVKDALLPAILLTVLVGLALFATVKRSLFLHIGKKFKIKIYPFPKILSVICALSLTATLLLSAAVKVNLPDFINYMTQQTTIFQDMYVDPSTANITFPEQKRNLIYIYLESMETTFLPEELGGGNDVNPIPELYELALENTNFSYNDSVGGFTALWGGTWTIGALVSHTSGIPLKTPLNIDGNSYGQDTFLPGITSLSNVLHENGYYQALMVGSDANFGGRKQYYQQHETDKIYDLYTARADGIVPEDYYVWWGMEDSYLFEYAKQELTKISKQEQPFAFTMLTVDTHHIGGYVCDYCGTEYPEQYENVLACSSKQVTEFVSWIQQQDFYDNTTIIICGDHPTMDHDYIARNIPEDYQRKVYNCFINSLASTDNTKNREFSSLDMFPSTLAAIGCTIEGDRLGLGTNLFSSSPTLCEELGTDEFSKELAKNSDYYTKNFFFE
ncbi:MAG: LTA synthase family protein [Lachnospiraceae bacterium]|nr:LTA synthase family protein [Lachnospiraceae bacterium]